MKINEFDKQVTQADIDQLEVFADKIFSKVGIDVNFTRHFLDRVNDERNGKPISMSELTRLFKQEQKRWGKKIAQLGPDEEAVMKDLQTDINLPFALRWDDKNNELDLIAKTVMRKKNFKTPNPEFPVENVNEERGNPFNGLPEYTINNYINELTDRLKEIHKSIQGQPKTDIEEFRDELYKISYKMKQLKNAKPLSSVKMNEESKAELYRLYTKAMKVPAGSPKHKELADKIAKLRKELAMDEDVDPVDMAAAAGVSGAVGSMIGRKVGKAVDRDLRGDGPEDRRRIKRIKQDRQKKLTKTPSVRGNANTATKPTSAPMTAKLPGVTRGGAGAGGAAINPKRVGGGGRLEPKLRSTPFNMFNEDFGSVPPLAELIVMAVVAKTSVDVLIGMFKVALKTGKGLKKLNDLRKRVAKMGQGVADYALPEATKDELIAKATERKNKAFYDAALNALHRLVSSKGTKQSVGGYAFDIARAFNGVNAKELENMYRAKFSESIIHEDTLAELNILRKKNDGVKQSNPLVVLDKLSDRNDDTPFPIKFYDGTSIKVTPKMARRFMNKYYDELEQEQRDIVDRYITTKNGFIQAVKQLKIAEGK